MNFVEEARKFVEEECKKPTSHYGYEPYSHHFAPVVGYARELAKELDADVEVVEIAGWLHDIGSIIKGRENHHLTGADIAEEKLKELGYDRSKTELVRKCILNHRGSVNNPKQSNEEKIIADADALSAFDHIERLFSAAIINEGKNSEEAKESVKQKLINSWNKLSFQESRDVIKLKYEAAMLLLK